MQATGIENGGGEPPGSGTEISNNIISANDIGLFLWQDCCSVHHNMFIDNLYFGALVWGSSNEIKDSVIIGGEVGAAAVATDLDAVASLRGVRILRTKSAPTQEIEWRDRRRSRECRY